MVAYRTRIASGVVPPCAALFTSACVALLVGCGDEDGGLRSSCSVSEGDGGATITCADGTHAEIESGSGAGACTVEDNGDGTKTIECDDGTSVEVRDGDDGTDGDDSEPGAPGADGDDGDPGADGDDGPPGASGDDGEPGSDGRSALVAGPGLAVEITGVDLPDDRRAVLTLSIRDAQGRPLDRGGLYTEGAVSARFVLAYLASSGGQVGQYVPYKTTTVTGKTIDSTPPVLASATQPGADSAGSWTEVDAATGLYTSRFEQALPEDFPEDTTHTVAGFLSRTVDGVQYAADPVFHFRPDGDAVTELREIVATDTCNGCHDTLAVHGGSRRDTGLCITCHTQGMADPESGNSLDFKQMIHKIHRGKNLPSVLAGDPYVLVGYNDAEHDYSDVSFPQAMENCTTCHQGAPDSDNWKTSITRAACTSCHDRTNFESTTPPGFVDHPAGDYSTDATCAGCHSEGDNRIGPYEVDVTMVHVPRTELPYRQITNPSGGDYGDVISLAPVLRGEIRDVTSVGPSEYPQVRFYVEVTRGSVTTPLDVISTPMNRLRFIFAGPTSDYVGYTQLTAATIDIAAGSEAGEFVWTSPSTMEDIADGSVSATGIFPLTGSMAVGMEGRIVGPATKPDGTPILTLNYNMHNDVFYVALSGPLLPRREATVVENCNTCHDELSAHGGSRNDPEYCVICHNATKDAWDTPAGMDVVRSQSVGFSTMIHAVHTGEQLENPGSAHDFSEIRFPGDRRNCEHCHVEDQYQIPLPTGLLASRVSDIDSSDARLADYFLGPVAAACTGCHDGESTAVHALTMSLITPPAVDEELADVDEACATCHASGQQYGLDTVHARLGL